MARSVTILGVLIFYIAPLPLYGFGPHENCVFECPDGYSAIPRPGHSPTANGCGKEGGVQFTSQELPVPQLESCCNEHDLCYGTCNVKKHDCDDVFKICMNEVCSEHSRSDEQFKKCDMVNEVFYIAVNVSGCDTYWNSQAVACECVQEKEEL